jgi:presenilin-like A22 family membrane protease
MEYSIMLLLIFSVISYSMLYVLWIFSIVGMLLNFLNCWYVTEFSQLLVCYWIFSIVGMLLNFLICYIFVAILLLFIISVYLENNIFIIQLFLIIRVSGLLFKLCLKGSPRMYLLHVLKMLWVFVKNVHKKN